MNKRLKKIIRKAHLYLGLASGLVVFIIAITGCCWAFQAEITRLIEGERSVMPENKPFITPEKARTIALRFYPDRHIHGVAYGHATDPVEVIFYQPEPEFYRSIYLNPYSEEVLDIKNHREGFFWFVLRGHLYLWLPKALGSQITAYGTMIFVIMLITGIVLWWPKNKKGRKQRLKFDWKATTRWRRKNFDLHSIVGFYVSVFALILAFSGLVMAFDWVYFVTYKAWGGDKVPEFMIPANVSKKEFVNSDGSSPINQLLPILAQEFPDYESFELHYPATDSSSIYVEISSQSGIHYSSDYRFYDRHTLAEIETPGIYGKYADASLADKVMRMNYDIHVGAIGGLPGKILAFLISLVTATLPVTGVLLWWGRKKKEKVKNVNLPAYAS